MKRLAYIITILTVYVAALSTQPAGETKISLPRANAKSYFGKSMDISGRRAIIASANAAHINVVHLADY